MIAFMGAFSSSTSMFSVYMVLVFGLSLFSIVVVNTLMETHHSFIKP